MRVVQADRLGAQRGPPLRQLSACCAGRVSSQSGNVPASAPFGRSSTTAHRESRTVAVRQPGRCATAARTSIGLDTLRLSTSRPSVGNEPRRHVARASRRSGRTLRAASATALGAIRRSEYGWLCRGHPHDGNAEDLAGVLGHPRRVVPDSKPAEVRRFIHRPHVRLLGEGVRGGVDL